MIGNAPDELDKCEKRAFSLDAFPEQLLGKVFQYVPSSSLDSIKGTCPQWASIVERYTGRLLITKNGKNGFTIDYEPLFDKLSMKSNFWVSLAPENPLNDEDDLDDSDEKSNSSVNELKDIPVISSPESIRKIGFVGNLGTQARAIFNSVLTSCGNVTGLFLHLSTFTTMYDGLSKGEDWNLSSLLPSLKELVIDCCGTIVGDTKKDFNHKHSHCSLYTFISCHYFPLLEKFILTIPYIEVWEGAIVFSISKFLGRHSSTLRRFSFHQKYEVYDDEYEESDKSSNEKDEETAKESKENGEGDCADKKSLRLYERLPPDDVDYLSLKQLAKNAVELRKLSLEEFHVVLIHSQESSPLWSNLIIQQTNFKKLIFVGNKIPCPSMTMDANSATLVTIRLDIRDVINLECFKNCKSLKYLTLRGNKESYFDSESEDDEENPNNSKQQTYTAPVQLMNARCLPLGLECIEIVNLRSGKDDVSIISTEMPSLRNLTLINLGWEGDLGLRLSHLALIWEKGQLDHFCIKASLNMMSYTELENESRCALNLLGCVVQSNSFTSASRFFLEVWKNIAGYYTVCKHESYVLDDDDIDVFQIPNKSQALLDDDDDSKEESETEGESGSETDDDVEEESMNEDEWEDCDDGSFEDDDVDGDKEDDR